MKSTSYLLMALALPALCKIVTSYKVHTRIVNRLGGGNSINVHCKSGNDDLGLNTVEDGGEYWFRFHINFTGTTLFCCTVSSKFGRIDFDAFDTLRDWFRCDPECSWVITKQGLKGYNLHFSNWDIKRPWL
ncbi:hypothetical protein MRB53_008689 [Persea americana]|uniref:Uncharacterized protein n=1 Tax=Persea americana TaxID=3435 RepID=A0ACC2MND3_PERAE|nr:hypothetical protein MRB53_008689 [Persea americana]